MATDTTDGYVYQAQEFTLVLNTGIDLTSETGNVELKILKPNGSEYSATPTIESPATDGLVSYQFAADELDEIGDWRIKTYLQTQQAPGRAFLLSVLPMWGSSNIPTAHEIRNYLENYCVVESKISSEWIARRRATVIKWLEGKIRKRIGVTEQRSELISGTGSSVIWVSSRPIVSVDNIEYVAGPEYTSPGPFSTETDLDTGMIKAKQNNEEGYIPVFPKGNLNIKVTYTAGVVDLPDDLRESIMALTAERVLMMIASQDGGGSNLNVGGYNRNFGEKGRYTDARQELARWGVELARPYMTGVVSG